MKTRIETILPISLVLALVLAGCNLPASTAPTPQITTPDLTQTAIYSLISTATALAGEPPVLPSATSTLPPLAQPSATLTVPPAQPPASATFTSPPPTAVPATETATAVPPTATAAPSNTPVSLAGPGARPAPKIIAYYLKSEPNIDGVFDEWSLDRYFAESVVYGGSNWKGENDLSSSLMVGWDDNYLYIAARVKDDVHVQGATGERLFRGDSVEVLLDTNVSKDYHQDELSNDDYQLGLSPGTFSAGTEGGTKPESYLWYPRNKAGAYVQVKVAATKTDNGYRIEAKIPWSLYGIKNPDIGWHFGFVFSVSDNDKTGANEQQSMVSTSSKRSLADPTTWGDLELRGVP